MIKSIIKKILPKIVIENIQDYKFNKSIKNAFKYDANSYIESCDKPKSFNETTLIGRIIKQYHVIEKGLTMPNRRLGFGYNIIIDLSNNCVEYVKKYNSSNCQLIHAIGVLSEYKKLHNDNNFILEAEVEDKLNSIENLKINSVTKQATSTKEEYFSKINSDFQTFSNSRKSVRHFSEKPISIDQINNALQLATNTPSACNRQAWRTYLYTNKEKINNILELQGGNRGFGHLSDKLIIITAEVGLFYGIEERNQAFIDGGIYAMNLLYSLHYNKVGACILNCAFTPDKDEKMRVITDVKSSEVFIAMIVCGNLPDEFLYPLSKRYVTNITHCNID